MVPPYSNCFSEKPPNYIYKNFSYSMDVRMWQPSSSNWFVNAKPKFPGLLQDMLPGEHCGTMRMQWPQNSLASRFNVMHFSKTFESGSICRDKIGLRPISSQHTGPADACYLLVLTNNTCNFAGSCIRDSIVGAGSGHKSCKCKQPCRYAEKQTFV